MPEKLKVQSKSGISTDKKILKTLKLYFKSQLLLLLINSVIFFLVLSLFKVKFALYLAIATGILSVVPTFGVLISAVISMIVSAVDGQSLFDVHPLVDALLLFLAYIVINQIIDLVLSPYIVGKVINISPLVLILSVVIGTFMFGIVGTIIAVPLVITLRIIIDSNKKID